MRRQFIRGALAGLVLITSGVCSAGETSFRDRFVPAFDRAVANLGVAPVDTVRRERAVEIAKAKAGTADEATLELVAEEQALAVLNAHVVASVTEDGAQTATVSEESAHPTHERMHCSHDKCSSGRALGACATEVVVAHHTDDRAHCTHEKAHCSDAKCSSGRALGACESQQQSASAHHTHERMHCSDDKCSSARALCRVDA